MNDGFGNEIRRGDFVVYATLSGHKPILTKARVTEVEMLRVKVKPYQRTLKGWRAPETMAEKWLHQPENVVRLPENVVRLVAPTYV